MSSQGRGTVLRCSGLSIGYLQKGGATRTVASGLDLELRRGEFVCLLGPNGAGKSTLIRALTGLEGPLSGEVELNGERLRELSPKERARRISVVLTEAAPLGMFSVNAIVALGRHPHTRWTGRLQAHDRERIAWALEAVGATPLSSRMVSELSDGERQKVMIARALAQEAGILFLDEPTAYLDLPRRVELMRTLRDLARSEGLSIALSTHDLDLALRCADRLWLFEEGGRVTTGAPEALALDGTIARVFASDKLDWDPEAGSFRMHREPCASVWIEGDGAALAWTQRALARIGYGVADTPDKSHYQVRCESSVDCLEWAVSGPSGALRRFDSIEALIEWMTHFGRTNVSTERPAHYERKQS